MDTKKPANTTSDADEPTLPKDIPVLGTFEGFQSNERINVPNNASTSSKETETITINDDKEHTQTDSANECNLCQ